MSVLGDHHLVGLASEGNTGVINWQGFDSSETFESRSGVSLVPRSNPGHPFITATMCQGVNGTRGLVHYALVVIEKPGI